jgi:hypothetical protein
MIITTPTANMAQLKITSKDSFCGGLGDFDEARRCGGAEALAAILGFEGGGIASPGNSAASQSSAGAKETTGMGDGDGAGGRDAPPLAAAPIRLTAPQAGHWNFLPLNSSLIRSFFPQLHV